MDNETKLEIAKQKEIEYTAYFAIQDKIILTIAKCRVEIRPFERIKLKTKVEAYGESLKELRTHLNLF